MHLLYFLRPKVGLPVWHPTTTLPSAAAVTAAAVISSVVPMPGTGVPRGRVGIKAGAPGEILGSGT